MKKRILSLLMSVVMVLTLLPMPVWAAVQNLGTYVIKDRETMATCTDIVGFEDATDNSVAHYVIGGKNYLQVASLSEADTIVYAADGKTVVMYLAGMITTYDGHGKVFTNFGKKCGQVNFTPVSGKTYYTAVDADGDDLGYIYVSDANGAKALMVGNCLTRVSIVCANTPILHTAEPVITDDAITGYRCSNCRLAAVEAPNAVSIPAGVQWITGNWYFPAQVAYATGTNVAPVAPPMTPVQVSIAANGGLSLESVDAGYRNMPIDLSNTVGYLSLSFTVNGAESVRDVVVADWSETNYTDEVAADRIAKKLYDLQDTYGQEGAQPTDRTPPFEVEVRQPVYGGDLGKTMYVLLCGIDKNVNSAGYCVLCVQMPETDDSAIEPTYSVYDRQYDSCWTTGVHVTFVEAVAPDEDGVGTLAHYAIEKDGQVLARCLKANADYADLMLKFDGRKDVYMYFLLLGEWGGTYDGKFQFASRFTNIGTRCGQRNFTEEDSYYIATDSSGNESFYIQDAQGATRLLVVNRLVRVRKVEDPGKIAHVWAANNVDDHGNIADIKCTKCGIVAGLYETPTAAGDPNAIFIPAFNGYIRSEDNAAPVVPIAERVGTDTVYVAPGDSTTLRVKINAEDTTKITCAWYIWDDNAKESVLLENETESYLTLNDITHRNQYCCRVRDHYGNLEDIWFTVNVENHLKVTQEGEGTYTLAPGEGITLQMQVSADDMTGLSYRWWKGDDTGFQIIEGANSDTYVVERIEKATEYIGEVFDQYGGMASEPFFLYVENHLTVTPAGDALQLVNYGANAVLRVQVKADDTSDLTYRWYPADLREDGLWHYEWDQYLEDVTGDTLALDAITEKQGFYCQVIDRFGNRRGTWLYASVDNHFYIVNAVNYRQYVPKGGSATLRVETLGDDLSGVVYRWYKCRMNDYGYLEWDSDSQPIAGAASDTFIVRDVQDAVGYRCIATDRYGNTDNTTFLISPDNELAIRAISEKEQYVAAGGNVTLQAKASAIDIKGLTYQWFESVYDPENCEWSEYTLIEGADGETCTAENIQTATYFRCVATDKYGTKEPVTFQIGIDNGLTVKAVGGEEQAVVSGTDITLRVEVGAKDSEGMTYTWYLRHKYNETWWFNTVISGATEPQYTLKNVSETTKVYCDVMDKFGNESSVLFTVKPQATVCGSYANGLRWSLDEAGLLVVSGSGVITAECPWAQYADQVRTVRVDKDVTDVETGAFSVLSHVTDLYIEGYRSDWNGFKTDVAGLNNAVVLHFWQDVSVKVLSDTTAANKPITATLTNDDGKEIAADIDGQTLSLDGVADGTYTLEIAQTGCVARKVTVEVNGDDVQMDTPVALVKVGNLNGQSGSDGETDVNDMQCLFEYLSTNEMNSTLVPEGETDEQKQADNEAYFKAVADVNDDNVVNILDYQALYELVKPAQ